MRASLTILILLLAGCVDEAPAAPLALPEASPLPTFTTATAIADCAFCYEPTSVVDHEGRIFVNGYDALAVSADGGLTFEPLTLPPPEGRTLLGDGILDVGPDGSLYYSALVGFGLGTGVPGASVFQTTGLQVARSDDGGQTWASNIILETLAQPSPSSVRNPDRQWLAFGPEGEAYIAYKRNDVRLPNVGVLAQDGVWVARSDDRGETWSEFVNAVPIFPTDGVIVGQPVVASDGALHVPGFLYSDLDGESYGLYVATSTDGGATFDIRFVDSPEGERQAGDFFPSLAIDETGRDHLAWRGFDGALRYATSDDGATWTAPRTLLDDTWAAPWVMIEADKVSLAAFERTGDTTSTLTLLLLDLATGDEIARVRAADVEGGGSSAATDFADLAFTAERSCPSSRGSLAA